jgi:hypothetical protein
LVNFFAIINYFLNNKIAPATATRGKISLLKPPIGSVTPPKTRPGASWAPSVTGATVVIAPDVIWPVTSAIPMAVSPILEATNLRVPVTVSATKLPTLVNPPAKPAAPADKPPVILPYKDIIGLV